MFNNVRMAQIGLTLSFSVTQAVYLLSGKKQAAPLTEVGRSSCNGLSCEPHSAGLFQTYSPETYNFEFWQSSNGTSLDTKIGTDWSIDASAYSGGIAQKI
jgi:hypothetical protein